MAFAETIPALLATMASAFTRERPTPLARNGTMDASMNASVRMDQAANTNAITGLWPVTFSYFTFF